MRPKYSNRIFLRHVRVRWSFCVSRKTESSGAQLSFSPFSRHPLSIFANSPRFVIQHRLNLRIRNLQEFLVPQLWASLLDRPGSSSFSFNTSNKRLDSVFFINPWKNERRCCFIIFVSARNCERFFVNNENMRFNRRPCFCNWSSIRCLYLSMISLISAGCKVGRWLQISRFIKSSKTQFVNYLHYTLFNLSLYNTRPITNFISSRKCTRQTTARFVFVSKW